jgi:hypothetical protein
LTYTDAEKAVIFFVNKTIALFVRLRLTYHRDVESATAVRGLRDNRQRNLGVDLEFADVFAVGVGDATVAVGVNEHRAVRVRASILVGEAGLAERTVGRG